MDKFDFEANRPNDGESSSETFDKFQRLYKYIEGFMVNAAILIDKLELITDEAYQLSTNLERVFVHSLIRGLLEDPDARDLTQEIMDKYRDRSDEPQCLIYGSEIDFELSVPQSEIVAKCRDILEHPDKYHGTSFPGNSFYSFTKFLWVSFPDDSPDRQLADVAQEEG